MIRLLTFAMHMLMSKSIVLDLNVKHLYCQSQWEPKQYKAGMKWLEDVVSANPSLLRRCTEFYLFQFHQYCIVPKLTPTVSITTDVQGNYRYVIHV